MPGVSQPNADIVEAVRTQLAQNADLKTRDGAQRFFKEKVKFHGVKSQAVRKISARYLRDLEGLKKEDMFSLCESLLKSGYGEEAFIAFEWAYSMKQFYQPEDLLTFERWIVSYVDNWAKCDTLCNHTIGAFIEMYPEYIEILKAWARSENRWLRRGSAVTLILPARNGEFIEAILEISDILLKDEDDLVQKGYGWMLKEASKSHMDEVFSYIMSRKAQMPRTALRYALEKMPDDMRREAMKR